MKKAVYIFIVLAAVVITAAAMLYCIKEKERVVPTTYWEESKENYNIYTVKIPDQVNFAGEEMPLDKYYVKESLDRELLINTYWHTSSILLFKRANRWFPVLEPILKKNNIPDDFKYLTLIESGLMQVTSPSGAKGFWQFLPGTAKDYGLEVNKHIDERYHIEKSTQAACEYLQDAYNRYGNWTMVAASYNAGQNRVSDEIELQKTNDYYALYLSDEASRYVYRIIAIKTIMENPQDYGFNIRENDLYPPLSTKEVPVEKSIKNLYSYAEELGISYKMLKNLNPWIQNSSLKIKKGKKYFIQVPE